MPLHHPKHRHHDDDLLPYRRSDDEAKPRRPYTPTFPSSSPGSANRLLVLFAATCLILAAASFAFAVSASRSRPPPPQPPPAAAFRCGRAEDSLRSFLASSSPGRNYSAADMEKVLAVVGVYTEHGSTARRAALRATWFPPNPEGIVSLEHGTGLTFRFVAVRPKDKQKMEDLQKEVDMHHDFLFIDADEDTKPPQKMLAFFKAAYHMFDAEFYVKADDDIYLRPDRLAALLAKERPEHRTYVGCMKKGPVVNDPNMKWYESSWELLGNEYFVHASGSLYALSSEVVEAVATAKSESLRMFDYEDVTIGAWMLAMNVKHEDNHAMCDPTCTPSSIAVWDKKCSGSCNITEKIKQLHNTTLCSKSPTLPPEVEEEE
ncbi:putative beta-1,3-galactosyltransferase 12 [Panicum miliaceum]|uniref:Hexosyltransferase n=1 Tax=Panicum miliaceum TaxID=4540 RepID=A0A3L6SZ15_PANMI|nr:putative beta-1,3-galactosyltransferase 12 [Panicum miliaceum]